MNSTFDMGVQNGIVNPFDLESLGRLASISVEEENNE